MTLRYWLRHGGGGGYFEVPRQAWLAVARNAGLVDELLDASRVTAWGIGDWSGYAGTEEPNAVVHGAGPGQEEEAEVSYNWGIRLRGRESWGDVRESYEDNEMDAEDRARYWLASWRRKVGRDHVQLVRQRIWTFGWEEVPDAEA